LLIFSPVWCAD